MSSRKVTWPFTGNKLMHRPNADRCLEWVRQQSDWDRKRSEYASQDTSMRPSGAVSV